MQRRNPGRTEGSASTRGLGARVLTGQYRSPPSWGGQAGPICGADPAPQVRRTPQGDTGRMGGGRPPEPCGDTLRKPCQSPIRMCCLYPIFIASGNHPLELTHESKKCWKWRDRRWKMRSHSTAPRRSCFEPRPLRTLRGSESRRNPSRALRPGIQPTRHREILSNERIRGQATEVRQQEGATNPIRIPTRPVGLSPRWELETGGDRRGSHPGREERGDAAG